MYIKKVFDSELNSYLDRKIRHKQKSIFKLNYL